MTDVEVEAHPPERGSRSLILASGCCTSCCCCSCCLHSVGALAGAAVGAALAAATPSELPGPAGLAATTDAAGKITLAPARPALVSRGVVVAAFWGVIAIVTVLALGSGEADLEVAALWVAVLFPAVVVVALFCVLPLAALAGGPGMKAWGKMLAGVAIGTTVGIAATLILGAGLVAVLGH